VNCAGQLGDQFRCVTDRHRFALRDGIELATFDELHAEVAGAFAFAHFVDGNDARMIQVSGGFGFPTKPLQMRLGGPLAKANDF
jgi:hypothetical protein